MPSKKRENQILTNFQNSHKHIFSWLQQQAKAQPDKLALYAEKAQYTFEELNQRVQKLAHVWFDCLPQSATHRFIAILGENQLNYIENTLAFWEIGWAIQCLNIRLSVEEIITQLKDSQCVYLLDLSSNTARRSRLAQALPELTIFTESMLTQANQVQVRQPIDLGYRLDQVASLMYTSGTTAAAKGVPQKFKQHLASATAAQQSLSVTPADCWLCAVPLFHISGLSILLRSLVIGHSLRLYRKFNPEKIHQDLLAGKGSIFSAVTKMLQDLLPYVPKQGYPNSFKAILLGGGPASIELLNACQQKQLPVMQSYGMTESCSQVFALPFCDALRKIGSAGKPLANIQCKIEKNTASQQTGEILIKGPNIVESYLHQRSSERWSADGWFHTGDLGYLDDEGFLYVVSRLSELIISGGENIYPNEIEQCLSKHPAIKEAVVVGKEDATWGQVPIAFLQLQAGFDQTSFNPEQLTEQLQALARYKWPKAFYFVKDFPRTASGKIQKRKLLTKERVNVLE
ncbi:o-succinylbenzoate--CoA ligase [Enterococcus columbae]|uniref:2-succinylbenzoate--CoA ligase n=1 Tax=Enterococcus columbae DSM 7374 = ATCC 51263 TaxID=1121865 RepID=S1NS96_9ENTE|nr:o-succinylbenzoate--CoA ligase [Enterococcus columbae]EOT38097.1 O-succinylbenzoate-CoA ligase [Enterococcus columbae DSM 7374 = ATCC 51263]EOW83764.1 O-succinylbenzoate-CoA ligase [Enterococcus columbae DSM 7374 = ATCC 51263]